MNYKQNLIFALAVSAVAVSASGNDFFHYDPNMSFLNFMSRSNNLFQQHPTRSLECFNYYIPLLNKITVDYESNYKGCLADSDHRRRSAEEATAAQRTDLANRSEISCALLSKCSLSESAKKELECYINGGSENAKTMYGINSDASDHLAALTEEYRVIINKENRCTNDTKRVYEKQSTVAYNNLNDCILGVSKAPTGGPPTDASTAAPTDVSTNASTDAPTNSSTDSPTDSPIDSSTNSSSYSSTNSPTNSPADGPTNAPTDAPATKDNSTKETSTEESDGDIEDILTKEDLSRMLAMKNINYRREYLL